MATFVLIHEPGGGVARADAGRTRERQVAQLKLRMQVTRASDEVEWAAVKPPAQPKLVRFQHLPPPAETRSDLRIRRSVDRLLFRRSTLTVTSGIPVIVAVHGRMTDGRPLYAGGRRPS